MLFVCCWQYDAFEIGFITTDDFTNADILEATYPAVSKTLLNNWSKDNAVPVVTGFLGKVFIIFLTVSQSCYCVTIARLFPHELYQQGWRSCAITTLGRGGSDLTATTIGKALGLREIQV